MYSHISTLMGPGKTTSPDINIIVWKINSHALMSHVSQIGMRTGGEDVSLRGEGRIAASSTECSSCRASQRQQYSDHHRGFGAQW